MNVIATWSGGKDSCLAAYKAQQAGHEIRYVANTISRQYRRVGFHGIQGDVIQRQAEAIGIPLLQQQTSPETYWKDFRFNLQKASDIDGVVFGDIFLEECYGEAQKICDSLGVTLIEPLWKKTPEVILKEFISLGFEAVIVSAQASLLGKDWIGRPIDAAFITDMKKQKNIDLCGENGEYHTVVTRGPLFRRGIRISQSNVILRDGYWFLDIQKYNMSRAS